jgi:hypothetical protein
MTTTIDPEVYAWVMLPIIIFAGNFIGMLSEDKLAIGTLTMRVIRKDYL